MNVLLSNIAEREGDKSRFMPPVPTAWVDRGDGNCEAVTLVNREFLSRCGVEAIYLVAQTLDIHDRFSCETKDALIECVLKRTAKGKPPKELLQNPPPTVAPTPLSGRQKKAIRATRRAVRQRAKETMPLIALGKKAMGFLLN